eukprot:gb/GECG01016205.1/.p1 GENE.gb/GECG01016205.1/~~gb/GECG01016205.1/.p1  ORF type:complete len:362 (+),score=35.98 gb/GECG01016205.1/:1-1086(+)
MNESESCLFGAARGGASIHDIHSQSHSHINTGLSSLSTSGRASPMSKGPSPPAGAVLPGILNRKELWKHASEQSLKLSILYLALVFVGSLTILLLIGRFTITTCFSEEESKQLHWPKNLEELKDVSHILRAGVEKHQTLVFFAFVVLYTFKQTFAIPGSLILNVTAGVLFGTVLGTLATSIFCALGGTFCFLLSSMFAGPVVRQPKIKAQVTGFQARVQQAYSEGTLFFYLLFLRLFPATPNFFLNMASYWVGVPVHYFGLSMSIGLLPYNFITVNAGSILEQVNAFLQVTSERSSCFQLFCFVVQLSTDNPVIDFWMFLKLFCISLVALLPTLFSSKLKKYAGVEKIETPTDFEFADKTI